MLKIRKPEKRGHVQFTCWPHGTAFLLVVTTNQVSWVSEIYEWSIKTWKLSLTWFKVRWMIKTVWAIVTWLNQV